MTRNLAPSAGIAFFALLLASFLLTGNSPSGNETGAKVLDYYTSHHTTIEVAGVVTVIAVFVGVIFFGMLRDYLRRHEASRGMTATAFGGLLLFAVSGGLSAGVDWALTDTPARTSAAAAQALNLVDVDVTYALMIAGLAILYFGMGLAIVRSALLPAWLGWIAFPLALCALVPPIGFVAFVGSGIWTLAISIALWRRLARTDGVEAAAVAGATG